MSLLETQTAIEAVAQTAGPAVIGLGRGARRGSGVVIDPTHAITLARNLRGEQVTVKAGPDGEGEARLVGVDAEADLAVLELSQPHPAVLEWASEQPLPIGTAVLALADPGGRGLRVTAGHVSAAGRSIRGPRGRRLDGIIEHTAPLPRGSGGGPLVDVEGRLLGLNAVRIDGGLILALPAAVLRARIEAILAGRATAPPRLGVAILPAPAARRLRRAVGLPDRDGLLVRAIEQGSAAERAGLLKGDLIVTAGEHPLTSIDDLHAALDDARDSGGIELTVVRGVDEHTLAVTLDGAPGAEVA